MPVLLNYDHFLEFLHYESRDLNTTLNNNPLSDTNAERVDVQLCASHLAEKHV